MFHPDSCACADVLALTAFSSPDPARVLASFFGADQKERRRWERDCSHRRQEYYVSRIPRSSGIFISAYSVIFKPEQEFPECAKGMYS